ncbi:MAG: TonB-dependent receptor [Chitinophagaceae bacterium]|nr:TonB-dependent receptor [Chitinophagaceae bacterium]MDP1762428.1 TonB-dependent receptor [Sediminibacterium sp.]MDP1810598.1 TonB-dependent receptor [Sediminibacterium sp.]MDP3128620.1 TonB-dependent receptor [Sediminibacterium sp.]
MSKKVTLLFTLLAGSAVYAQNDSLPIRTLDEVVVTANKIEQKQSSTGKVITVITHAQIEKSNGKTIAQLLNEQAGITVNGALNNAGSVQTVYMRGASAGRTLILMDGIPLNDPSTITNDFDLNLFSINDVERIEVCKGAQSTLYGSDAIAGVINIITVKKDVQKAFNIKGTVSQGSMGTSKNNLQVFGKKNKLTYTARFARLATKGFSSAYDSSGTRNFDNDAYNGTVTNAQLLYQVSPALSLKTFAMYSQYTAGIDAGVFSDDRDYNIHHTSFITGTGFLYKKGPVTITGTYQFSEISRNYRNDSVHKTGTIFEDNAYFGKSQFVELYAGTWLGKGFTLLTGLDYRYHSYNQHYYSVSSYGPYSSSFSDTSMNQKAMYASLIYNSPDKKINIEGGVRYNRHSRYGNNSTYTFNPSYSITNQVKLFASISSGFKAPSLYQLSINDKLEAEKSVNYETGISFQQKKISTRLVYFNRQIKNGIDYNYITYKYFNYLKQTVNGVELELSLTPVEKLTITANYTFLGTEEITQNRVTVKDTITYNYLLRRPKHSFHLTAGLDLAKGLYVSVSGKYAGKRFDIGGYKKADVSLNSYFILGANASYTVNPHVIFFADAQNITNQKFFEVRGFNSIPSFFNAGVTFNW